MTTPNKPTGPVTESKQENFTAIGVDTSKHEAAALMLAEIISAHKYGRGLDEAVHEVLRELTIRKKCFPRWVEEGRIMKLDAKERLERLDLAHHILSFLAKADSYLNPTDATIAQMNSAVQMDTTRNGDKTDDVIPF